MLVYVARHGEAEHNPQDLFHDTTVPDVSLTDKGIKQVDELANKLEDIKLDAIYASRLRRTQQTAEAVNRYHNLPITIDPLLDDIVSGIAGHPVSEFRDMITHSENPWHAHFEGGESYEDNKARATKFLAFLKTQPYECVLVVTSGGVANMLYGITQGMTNEEMYPRPIDNAALLSFELNS
jgi:broad specificity phosphatase PhoE